MAETAGVTNTEQLLRSLHQAEQQGISRITFRVGKYTGNGPAVIGALRHRGFSVQRLHNGTYELCRA